MTFDPLCIVCIDMLASEYGVEEPHEAHADLEPEFDPCTCGCASIICSAPECEIVGEDDEAGCIKHGCWADLQCGKVGCPHCLYTFTPPCHHTPDAWDFVPCPSCPCKLEGPDELTCITHNCSSDAMCGKWACPHCPSSVPLPDDSM